MKKIEAAAGDFLKPDGWNIGELITDDGGYKDSAFPGCDFRIMSRHGYNLAINIKITGRTLQSFGGSWGWMRCKIEFVGDGEPSNFSGGWLKIHDEEGVRI